MEHVSRIIALKTFFNTNTTKPVETAELMAFWKACNESERQEFSQSAATQLGLELSS